MNRESLALRTSRGQNQPDRSSSQSAPQGEETRREDAVQAVWGQMHSRLGNAEMGGVARSLADSPQSLYLQHLERVAGETGLDVSTYLPWNAQQSWTSWILPYYNVLHTEQARAEAAGPAAPAAEGAVVSLDARGPSQIEDGFQQRLDRAGAGRPLSAEEQAFVERVHGRRLPGARVHEGTSARQAARDVNAYAFAVGQDVYMGSEVDLSNPRSAELFAHETAHVVQDSQGRIPESGGAMRVSGRHEAHELEAEAVGREARRAVEGGDPWGLGDSRRFDRTGQAIVELLREELPAMPPAAPAELVQQGLGRALEGQLRKQVNFVGLERQQAMSALLQRYDTEGPSQGLLRDSLGTLGMPGPELLQQTQANFAPYPDLASSMDSLAQGLIDGPGDVQSAGASVGGGEMVSRSTAQSNSGTGSSSTGSTDKQKGSGVPDEVLRQLLRGTAESKGAEVKDKQREDEQEEGADKREEGLEEEGESEDAAAELQQAAQDPGGQAPPPPAAGAPPFTPVAAPPKPPAAPAAEAIGGGSVQEVMGNYVKAKPSVKAASWTKLGGEIKGASEQEASTFEGQLPELHAKMGGAGEGSDTSATKVESPKGDPSQLTQGAAQTPPKTELEPTPPQPASQVANAAGSVNFQTGGDTKEVAKEIGRAIGSVPTRDGNIQTSPGVPPQVPLTGATDPKQLQQKLESARQQSQKAAAEAKQKLLASPGAEKVQPLELDEVQKLEGLEKPEIGETAAIAKMDEFQQLGLDAQVQASFDENYAQQMESSLQGAQQQMDQAIESRDQEQQAELDRATKEAEQLSADAQTAQEQEVNTQKQAIEAERQKTMQAQQKAVSDVEAKARSEHAAKSKEIDRQVTAQQSKISAAYTDAQSRAEGEIKRGEAKAEAEKRKAEQEANDKSWWEKACDFVKSAIDSLKKAINAVFDAVRSAINTIIDGVKALATKLIDEVCSFVCKAIAAFGELLKGAIQNLLGSVFPGLADALCGFVDQAVQKAQETVQKLAEDLKKKVTELCDSVKNTLNSILDAFQGAINAALDIAAAVATGDWEKLLFMALEAALKLCGISPDEFYAFIGKAEDTIKTILENPGSFISNCINAVGQGFSQFASNFTTHLQNGFISWMTGVAGEAGITMPASLDVKGVLSIAMQVMGISKDQVMNKVSKKFGASVPGGTARTTAAAPAKAVPGQAKPQAAAKTTQGGSGSATASPSAQGGAQGGAQAPATQQGGAGGKAAGVVGFVWDKVETLMSGGMEALANELAADASGIVDTVINGIQSYLMEKVIVAAVTKIASMFNPVGALVQAVLTAWNLYTFLRDQIQRIWGVVQGVVNSLADIAAGNIGSAAAAVEGALAGLVPVAIDLLAKLLGLGGLGKKIRDIIQKIQDKVDQAIDKLLDRVAGLFKGSSKTPATAKASTPANKEGAVTPSTNTSGGRPAGQTQPGTTQTATPAQTTPTGKNVQTNGKDGQAQQNPAGGQISLPSLSFSDKDGEGHTLWVEGKGSSLTVKVASTPTEVLSALRAGGEFSDVPKGNWGKLSTWVSKVRTLLADAQNLSTAGKKPEADAKTAEARSLMGQITGILADAGGNQAAIDAVGRGQSDDEKGKRLEVMTEYAKLNGMDPAKMTPKQRAIVAQAQSMLHEDIQTGAEMRKIIPDDSVGNMLTNRGSSKGRNAGVGGSIGVAKNTNGLTAPQMIGSLGLDYDDKTYVKKDPATGQFRENQQVTHVDFRMTQEMKDKAAVPVQTSTDGRKRNLQRDMAQQTPGVPTTSKWQKTGPDDPFTGYGGTAAGPRLPGAHQTINQEVKLVNPTDRDKQASGASLSAGDTMKRTDATGRQTTIATLREKQVSDGKGGTKTIKHWETDPNLAANNPQLAEEVAMEKAVARGRDKKAQQKARDEKRAAKGGGGTTPPGSGPPSPPAGGSPAGAGPVQASNTATTMSPSKTSGAQSQRTAAPGGASPDAQAQSSTSGTQKPAVEPAVAGNGIKPVENPAGAPQPGQVAMPSMGFSDAGGHGHTLWVEGKGASTRVKVASKPTEVSAATQEGGEFSDVGDKGSVASLAAQTRTLMGAAQQLKAQGKEAEAEQKVAAARSLMSQIIGILSAAGKHGEATSVDAAKRDPKTGEVDAEDQLGRLDVLQQAEALKGRNPASYTEAEKKVAQKAKAMVETGNRIHALKQSGLVSGDQDTLRKVTRDASDGQSGAVGEIDAMERWTSAGKKVEVNGETQNSGHKNPDYRVDGVLTEVKTRTEALNDRWVKDQIGKSNDQMKKSPTGEVGAAELQLKGNDANVDVSIIEQQVRSNFNDKRGSGLNRVTVVSGGQVVGEWERDSSGTVRRIFPKPE